MSRPEAVFKVGNDPIPHVFVDDTAPSFSPHLAGSFGVGEDDLETLDYVANGVDNKSGLAGQHCLW